MVAALGQALGMIKALAALLFVVPLTSDQGWQVLEYRGIPAHNVRFSEAGLAIQVTRSAAPVIYRLPASMTVRSVEARGRIDGTLNVSASQQGQPGFDDFALRVGLVESGPRRPGFMQRRLAPEWMRTLFSLAPPGTGVSRVHFFNLAVGSAQVGNRRSHPSSDLLYERVIAVPQTDGRFDWRAELDAPTQVIAIWLASDGDDTQSTFVATIDRIELLGPAGLP